MGDVYGTPLLQNEPTPQRILRVDEERVLPRYERAAFHARHDGRQSTDLRRALYTAVKCGSQNAFYPDRFSHLYLTAAVMDSEPAADTGSRR